jgi:plasmid stabilization system protein ParE
MDKAVVWSVKAKNDLKAIKDFYDIRNRSSTYSNKLLKEFRKAAMLICKYPEAAIIVDYEQVKGFIILDYIL